MKLSYKTIAVIGSAISAVIGVMLPLSFYYVSHKELSFLQRPVSEHPLPSQTRVLHYYEKPEIRLDRIRLDLVYFVPKGESEKFKDWQKVLNEAGQKLKKFYELQFEGLTTITVQVYPKFIPGEKEIDDYDGVDTGGGNPNGLLAIEAELTRRLYDPRGNLFLKEFQDRPGEYRVLGIVYEGVGASGSGVKQTFLVSRDYLTDDVIHGLTFMAHEFGHTFGLPDFIPEGEEHSELAPYTSDDVMGAGRYKPLEFTYLADKAKQSMISP